MEETKSWWETEWYKEWERLARKEYQGKIEVPIYGILNMPAGQVTGRVS